ncbi:diguanylate cyclase/phosphodiesterase (GGDEF & EAL domains) with PAS/PAC sensor(s) [Chitinispirillum alkaliphilum]|nr:diguanylate cyclase/phosphodiesterase (GGDEF & EAL domains) with PAS/PAC sensor(s) [Chitinispirillum alkaliphilum]
MGEKILHCYDDKHQCDKYIRAILETTAEGFFSVEASSQRIIDVNDRFCTMSGYNRDEILQLSVSDIEYVLDNAQIDKQIQEVINKGSEIFETKHKRKNGAVYEVEISASYLDFSIDKIICFCRDITERKRKEIALKHSEEKYRSIVECVNDVIYRLTPEGIISFASPNWPDKLGHSLDEVLGASFEAFVHPGDVGICRDAINGMVAQKMSGSGLEFRVTHKSGQWLWYVSNASPQFDSQGRVVGIIAVGRCIDERKKMEQALRKSEERFRNVIDAAEEFVYEVDTYLRVTFISDKVKDVLGYEAKEIIGKSLFDFLGDNADVPGIKTTLNHIVRNRKPIRGMEYCCSTKCGQNRVLFVNALPFSDEEGEIAGYQGTVEDVTCRKTAEESLRQSEEKYRAIFDKSVQGMYLHDFEGKIIDVNQMACEQSGYSREELLSKTIFDFGPIVIKNDGRSIEHLMREWKTWNPGERVILELESRKKDGRVYTVEISTGVIRYGQRNLILALAQDITVRRKTEESLLNIQKLESLGILAGGIAHDFNNLLTGIFGFIDMARNETSDESVRGYLTEAVESIDRARGLTNQLLTFARGGAPVKKPCNMPSFIKKTALFALSGSKLSCRFGLPDELWMCNIDAAQIAQVLDNIIINAIQAMPSGGEIEISAVNTPIRPEAHPKLSAGDYLRITIKDYGTGIPENIQTKIFDPFFTTKLNGHGLGLATSFSIIKRHGGCIEVESVPGKGSVFFLYIPTSRESIPGQPQKISRAHRGTGCILVMDDDELIQATVKNMLKMLGYTSLSAKEGAEAIEMFYADHKGERRITGMIFDLTIPGGMGGLKAVTEIRNTDREIPVIVASGYADDPVIANPERYGFTASICKPFRVSELAEVLAVNCNKSDCISNE